MLYHWANVPSIVLVQHACYKAGGQLGDADLYKNNVLLLYVFEIS